MPNTYVTLDVLTTAGVMNITSTADNTRLLNISESVGRAIDRWCNRYFYTHSGTFVYDGDGGTQLIVADLISIDTSGLKTDDNLDGTYSTTWATTDYILRPSNADPTGVQNYQSKPYTRIEVNKRSDGTQDIFPQGQESVQIAGKWGYWQHMATAIETVASDGSFTTGTVTIKPSTNVDINAGHTILIDAEQLYVRGTGTDGTAWSVVRGVNGSTATAHANSAVIQYYIYPDPIREVSIIETAKLWRRKDSGYASFVGFPDAGQIGIVRGFDEDTRAMLSPYRRFAMGGFG